MARIHNFSPNDERALRLFIFNESMRLVDTMAIALRILLAFIGTLTLAIGGVTVALSSPTLKRTDKVPSSFMTLLRMSSTDG